MESPLTRLQELGQSPWHDNIRRDLLTSGKLARMVADGDVTGLTSNPTIFEQAIGSSRDYDEQLAKLARAGKNAEEIFDALQVEDIRGAAQVFAPVFERTHGADGYVSIEVAPKHARDSSATIAEAERLWHLVDKPNLMIKIPATREGLPAIEECIFKGINVNVTLIFSLDRYAAVMDAYSTGLTRRFKMGADLGRIASVASFFVSRVDTAIDKTLEERVARGEKSLEPLMGLAAIANAKLAYQAFLSKFSGTAWERLAQKGGRKQRPLWASTSTKNPRYPDVYYVEALVGPDTVDTLPPATIEAYRDHGKPTVRLTEELGSARSAISKLEQAGIKMAAVTAKLEEDGVASFAKSFDTLLAVVEERRKAALAK